MITIKAKSAHTFLERLFGLLNPKNPRIMVFHTHFGIHTFFMKTPIDVILLNDTNTVVKLKSFLKPNKFFLYHPQYSTVIEMPKGAIHKYRIKINDKISIA